MMKIRTQGDYNKAYKQSVRRRTRNWLGIGTSGAMSLVFPYMVGPAAVSAYGVHKANQAQEALALLEQHGFRPRTRDQLRGIVEGALQKLPLTFMLWGHEEVFFSLQTLLEEAPGHPTLVEGATEVLHGHQHVLDVPGLGEINEVANAPINGLQDAMGIMGADDMMQNGHGGWHDTPENVAQNVFVVGAAAAAIDQAADKPFDWWDKRGQGKPKQS